MDGEKPQLSNDRNNKYNWIFKLVFKMDENVENIFSNFFLKNFLRKLGEKTDYILQNIRIKLIELSDA